VYAIIENGGKQYKVSAGDLIKVEKNLKKYNDIKIKEK
jgi:ribosomal protein L21